MSVDVREVPRKGWDPLPGSVGIVGRVLVREGRNERRPDLAVAELRFSEDARIEPHPGEGQQVRWPKGIVHGLWTDGSTMTTLMIERLE